MSDLYVDDFATKPYKNEIFYYDLTEYCKVLGNVKEPRRRSVENCNIIIGKDGKYFLKRPSLIKNKKNKKQIEEKKFLSSNKNRSRRSICSLNPKRVTFPDKFVDTVNVESYKKYNVENTSKDPYYKIGEGKVREYCSCNVF